MKILLIKDSDHYVQSVLDPLPDYKNLASTKLKAFADDKLNVAKLLISLSHRVENIVGKGENAGYQCFQKASFSVSLKIRIVW